MELSNPQHEAYAQHRAAGLNKSESARRAQYADSTCANVGLRLDKDPAVSARIAELRESQDLIPAGQVGLIGIRSPMARVCAKEERWRRLNVVMYERAKDETHSSVPGYKTGLLCVTIKSIGAGKNAYEVREYRVDTGMLSEMQSLEDSVAEELGQAVKRKESYSEVVNTHRLEGTKLQDVLKAQLSNLGHSERASLAKSSPELAEELKKLEAIEVKPEPGAKERTTPSET